MSAFTTVNVQWMSQRLCPRLDTRGHPSDILTPVGSYGSQDVPGKDSQPTCTDIGSSPIIFILLCRTRYSSVSFQVYRLQIVGTQTECCDGYTMSENGTCIRK